MTASPAAQRHEYTVAVTRLYDAPRERVFEAWTRAEQLALWFGPKGFTIHSCEADPRPSDSSCIAPRTTQKASGVWTKSSP